MASARAASDGSDGDGADKKLLEGLDTVTLAEEDRDGDKSELRWPSPGVGEAAWHFVRRWWWFGVTFLFGWSWNSPRPSSPRHKKVIIIGDSVAAGYGDYTTCLGAPGVLRHVRRDALIDPRVRLNWSFLNYGAYGSTSADWRPDCKVPPRVSRFGPAFGRCRRDRRSLWKRTFSDPRLADVDVVVVCVGINDGAAGLSPKDTADNIRSITRALSARRPRPAEVVVCSMPLRWRLSRASGTGGDAFRADRERARLVRQAVTAEKGAVVGADLASAAYNRPNLYTPDALHFSADGYRRWASDLLEALVLAMVRVEWQRWVK